VSPTSCTAAGTWFPSGPTESATPLALAWNGKAWAIEPTGTLSGNLTAVSCATATSCVAGGTARDMSWPSSPAIADSWDGTAWSSTTVPQPAGSTYTTLSAVSCLSATSCLAVGDYGSDFSATWNGTRWSLGTMPAPAGGVSPTLAALSCTSSRFCVAVGQYLNDVDTPEALVVNWNGSVWSIASQPVGLPVGATLTGVSCASASACAAVGSYQDSHGNSQPLAETWDGTSWTVATTSLPAAAESGSLDGVSCLETGACTAVGSYDTLAAPGLPFAATATLPVS